MNKLFKIIAIFLVFNVLLFALEPIVDIEADKSNIVSGESVKITLSITANKNAKIKIGKFDNFDGVKILNKKLIKNYDTVAVGDKTEEIVEKSLIFVLKPKKDIKIKPILVVIDGKEFKTAPFNISLIKEKVTKPKPKKKPANLKFGFKMSIDKSKVVVGEPFIVTLILSQPIDMPVSDIKYNEPKFKNCTVTSLGGTQLSNNPNFITRIAKYAVIANKAGVIKAKPAVANLNMQITPQAESVFGFFGDNSQIKTIKTNSVTVSVEKKPANAQIVGDYIIKSTVTKKNISGNKQINYTLIIKGIGDLSSLDELNLNIDGITIYPEDATVKKEIKNGKIVSSYSKKFVFIADSDFTIPSFEIDAYSPTKKKLYALRTKPVVIKVKSKRSIINALKQKTKSITSSKKQATTTPEIVTKSKPSEVAEVVLDVDYYKQKIDEANNSTKTILWFIVGLLAGIVGTMFAPKLINLIKTKDEKSALYGSYHEALNILYPHTTKSAEIEEMVKALYEIINGNKEMEQELDKAKLDKIIAKIKKSKK